MAIQLVLCDLREEVVNGWKEQFHAHPEVDIRRGDILETDVDALVIPGNAFGFLDHGLQLSVCERLGWSIQDRLRDIATRRPHGELLVGEACIVPVPADVEPRFKYLVYTCLYRTPKNVAASVNAFLASRGVFLALGETGAGEIGSIAFPGIGTGSCGYEPRISARQIRYAYELYTGDRHLTDKNLTQLTRRERKLRSLPRRSAPQAKE